MATRLDGGLRFYTLVGQAYLVAGAFAVTLGLFMLATGARFVAEGGGGGPVAVGATSIYAGVGVGVVACAIGMLLVWSDDRMHVKSAGAAARPPPGA